MNKIPGLFGVAALIFTLGIFSGNLITLPSGSVTATNQLPTAASDLVAADFSLEPVDGAVGEAASFADFVDRHPSSLDSKIQLMSSTTSVDAASEQQIREVIVEEFPELDDETIEGWVAGYAGTSLETLGPLLRQKKLLPNIIPSRNGEEIESVLDDVAESSNRSFFRVCQSNLNNAFTIGFRRQSLFGRLTDVSAQSSANLELLSSFDFTPGELQTSSSILHLAIEGHSNHFFQLNPGRILTRCGAFERLSDGRIGIVHGETQLALDGISGIPLEATNIVVTTDGSISFSDVESESQSAGQIKLVAVQDLSSLSSANGVYFTVADSAQDVLVKVDQSLSIVSGALESSNVDSAAEWKQQEHIQRLLDDNR